MPSNLLASQLLETPKDLTLLEMKSLTIRRHIDPVRCGSAVPSPAVIHDNNAPGIGSVDDVQSSTFSPTGNVHAVTSD